MNKLRLSRNKKDDFAAVAPNVEDDPLLAQMMAAVGSPKQKRTSTPKLPRKSLIASKTNKNKRGAELSLSAHVSSHSEEEEDEDLLGLSKVNSAPTFTNQKFKRKSKDKRRSRPQQQQQQQQRQQLKQPALAKLSKDDLLGLPKAGAGPTLNGTVKIRARPKLNEVSVPCSSTLSVVSGLTMQSDLVSLGGDEYKSIIMSGDAYLNDHELGIFLKQLAMEEAEEQAMMKSANF